MSAKTHNGPDFKQGDIWKMSDGHSWERHLFIISRTEDRFTFWNLTMNVIVSANLSIFSMDHEGYGNKFDLICRKES